jgi:integrase
VLERALSHSVLIFQTSFAGIGMNLSLADLFFFLPLRRKCRQGFARTCKVYLSQLKSAYSMFCISASRTPDSKTYRRVISLLRARYHLWAGVDIRTVQAWMGHTDLASTMRYLKPNRDAHVKVEATFAGS